MNEMLVPFLEKNGLIDVLDYFGQRSFLHKKSAIGAKGTTILDFVPVRSIDYQGDIVKGSTINKDFSEARYYKTSILVNLALLKVVFSKLVKKGSLEESEVIVYLEEKGLFYNDSTPRKAEQGLNHFFNGEYIASMHILIPTLEDILVKLLIRLNISAIKLSRSPKGTKEISTQDRSLSNSLLDKFKYHLPKDVIYQLKFVLTKPLGFSFRHKIAHGKLHVNDCHIYNCFLIISQYILIASFIKKKSNE